MRPRLLNSLLALAVSLAGLIAPLAAQAQTYELRSKKPGLVVTGSPANPGGGAPVHSPLGELSTRNLQFNPTAVGSEAEAQVVLSNIGSRALTLLDVRTEGAAFSAITSCGSSLLSQGACATTVRFAPAISGALTGTLTFASNAANGPLVVNLSGSGTQAHAQLTADESSSFGEVQVGQSSTRTFTFANSGNAPVTGVRAMVLGAGVSLASNSCGTPASPGVVAANSSCALTLNWAPGVAGPLDGASLSVSSSAPGSPHNLPLSGFGTQAQGALSGLADFGTVNAGSSQARTYKFINTGTATATNVRVIVAGANVSVTSNECGTPAAPGSLEAGQDCDIVLTWTPSGPGSLSDGSLTVASSAVNSPATLTLSGTALNP